VSDHRFAKARWYTGITPHRYETAESSLIARKLPNKAGAIAVAGGPPRRGPVTW
jgi:hypothetical protein